MRTYKYTASDLPDLMDKIVKYSIGAEDWFERVGALHETTKNYPPYNVIHESNVKTVVEIALAGFKKAEVFVYTEHGKLFVGGQIGRATSELQSHSDLVCRLLLEKKKMSPCIKSIIQLSNCCYQYYSTPLFLIPPLLLAQL